MEAYQILKKLQNLGTDVTIIGAIKCGQNSLGKYLTDYGINVRRIECFFKNPDDATELKQYPDTKIVVILRDNVQRIWSSYTYFKYFKNMTLEEYLNTESNFTQGWGQENPILQANYNYWLKVWEKFNPTVFWLEDLKKLPNFPHENKTVVEQIPQLTEDSRRLIHSHLKMEMPV